MHQPHSVDLDTLFEVVAWELIVAFAAGLTAGWYICSQTKPAAPTKKAKKDTDSADSDDDDDEDVPSIANVTGECKMVLVVRNDLNMTKGKVAAQCGHATLAAYKKSVKQNADVLKYWESRGQMKIALKANNEEELLQLYESARNAGIVAAVIQDAGHTQVAAGSRTVLAIGPDVAPKIDKITGHLKLF